MTTQKLFSFTAILCLVSMLGLMGCTPKKSPPPANIPPLVKPVTPVSETKKEEKATAENSKDEFSKGTPRRSGKSYVTRGVRYYLLANSDGYDETGIGTWYGPGFHGRKTASGEIYNMHGMTAAHRTLPFGTRVKVTNLQNGKSVVVRITDRGPFSPTKIIDLTRKAGEIIGIRYAGIAKVRVQALK